MENLIASGVDPVEFQQLLDAGMSFDAACGACGVTSVAGKEQVRQKLKGTEQAEVDSGSDSEGDDYSDNLYDQALAPGNKEQESPHSLFLQK